MSFIHLHVHTEYSLLDGFSRIEPLVSYAKEQGFDALAITDHGVMYGEIAFYRACLKQGIKPILGCEIYVAPESRLDREPGGEDRYYHLVLLAENNVGYQNLIRIVSQGFKDGFYYKPRVDKEILRKFSEGIIATSACLAGEVQKYLSRGQYESAKKAAETYRAIFGENNFFLELQDHGYDEQKQVNQGLLRLSKDTGIPLVATNDVHYIKAEDAEAHDALLCLQTQKKLSDEDRMRYAGGQFYLKSEEEMKRIFTYVPEALENTKKIADRCNVTITFGETKLPKFQLPENYTSKQYLQDLCEKGFKKKYPQDDGTARKQMEYELSVIEKMGYVDYFLIVWDFIHYAKENDIPVGPGRGSAAGSIVSYVLDITTLDPLKYDLFFERFLNPERVSMPDIDVDFCYVRRQEVIDYVTKKYGADCVAQIVTFGTLKAKGVLRDVARIMDYPYAFGDSLAKMVPDRLPDVKEITLDIALNANPDFKEIYETNADARRVIDMGRRLEGLPRHTSMHAAGVVISGKPTDEYVPLSRTSPDSPLTTQFTMTVIEELGLLKMDFLGLRTLTVIQDAVKNIELTGKKKIDINNLPMDDAETYKMMGNGDLDGVFQLEQPGMRAFIKQLKPQCIEDVIAGIALYRPGPMDNIPTYIKGKEHPSEVSYLCPELEPILKGTYGVIVYQEQVMQIVQKLAGYSLGRADMMRRAMSKKKPEVILAERKNFVFGNEKENVPGCVKNGVKEEIANQIYDLMVDFAHYAFNKAHAAVYALVSYQTAWLKRHYPKEFLAALMTSVIGDSSKAGKLNLYIETCRNKGIEVLPPDVNESYPVFFVNAEGKIRYPLSAIKGIGINVVTEIVKNREENGPFKDLNDFMMRLSSKEVNKKTLENLIKAGAFDCFSQTRREQMVYYPELLERTERIKNDALNGQMSFFSMGESGQELQADYPALPEYEKSQLLEFELEVLGAYFSGHPLDDVNELLKRNVINVSADFVSYDTEDENEITDSELQIRDLDGKETVVGGIIKNVKTKVTKKGDLMGIITLEDLYGTMEILAFPKTFNQYRLLLTEDSGVLIFGRISVESGGNAKVIMQSAKLFSEVLKEVWLQFENEEEYQEKISEVQSVIAPYEGSDRMVVFLKDSRKYRRMLSGYNFSFSEDSKNELEKLLGNGNVKVVYQKVFTVSQQ